MTNLKQTIALAKLQCRRSKALEYIDKKANFTVWKKDNIRVDIDVMNFYLRHLLPLVEDIFKKEEKDLYKKFSPQKNISDES